MLVIVEGVDRVGKTTLCTRLSEHLHIPIFKEELYTCGKNWKADLVTEQLHAVIRLHKQLRFNLICDRFHLSELVYGYLERGYENKYMMELDKEMALDSILLFVKHSRPWEVQAKEHGKDQSKHEAMMDYYFGLSDIRYKFYCDYNSLDGAVKYTQTVLELMK